MAERRRQTSPIRSTEFPKLGDLPLVDLIPRMSKGLQAPLHLPELVSEIELAVAPHKGQRFYWFSVPPRHWKTITLVHGMLKHLLRWPDQGVGYFSHTQAFANKQSRSVRKLAETAQLKFAGDANRQDEWELTTGGGLFSRGISAIPAGIGLRLAIIDDPFLGRDDANSKAKRDLVASTIEDDILPRLTPDGCVFLVHTRWTPDDAIGRVQRQKKWRGLNKKALSGPEEDQPLLPSMWSYDYLDDIRQSNPYKFASLYQGNPIPPGTQVFRDATCFDWPDALPNSDYMVGYGVDLAYSAKTAGDWSVCVRLLKISTGIIDPETRRPISKYFVADVQRKHVDAPSFALTLKAVQTSQPGPMLWYAATSEFGAGQFIAERVPGFYCRQAKVDKLQRAQRCAEAWNLGRVLVPSGEDRPAWVEDFVDEVTNFTGVKDAHDDQVDALAAAFDLLEQLGESPDDEDQGHGNYRRGAW